MKEIKLCECGCGQPAPIAKETSTKRGHVKGQPIRFIRGHNRTVKQREPFVEPILEPETRAIQLTQNKFAIVDDADFEWLNQWRWSADKGGSTWYAKREAPKVNGKRGSAIRMHQMIIGNGSAHIDHIDGDGLNNTRANLRPATPQQNQYNQGLSKANLSGFKGVTRYKRHKKWHAQIHVDGKRIHLGYFDSVEEAAHAYDRKAIELFGEYARLNFI